MDSLPLSALNHFLYCSRRAYLIHAERVFVDNDASVMHTVIEVNGRDRLGFLFDVTRAITALGLHAGTEDARAELAAAVDAAVKAP
jgi:[protein-PII] uridylyltransferase